MHNPITFCPMKQVVLALALICEKTPEWQYLFDLFVLNQSRLRPSMPVWCQTLRLKAECLRRLWDYTRQKPDSRRHTESISVRRGAQTHTQYVCVFVRSNFRFNMEVIIHLTFIGEYWLLTALCSLMKTHVFWRRELNETEEARINRSNTASSSGSTLFPSGMLINCGVKDQFQHIN